MIHLIDCCYQRSNLLMFSHNIFLKQVPPVYVVQPNIILSIVLNVLLNIPIGQYYETL